MYSNEIIVTCKSLRSNYMEDIINSNRHFLNELFQVKMHKNEVSQEAMQSYYVDFYHRQILKSEFSDFIYHFYSDKNLITHIEHALSNLGCVKNLLLFNQIIHFTDKLNKLDNFDKMLEIEYEYKEKKLFGFFSKKFKALQEDESLIEKNYSWLSTHPHLTSVQEHTIKDKLLEVHLTILERYEYAS